MSFRHNDVEVNINRVADTGKTQIRIGSFDEKSKLMSIEISSGTLTFDLNKPENLIKCLDLFSAKDLNKMMVAITNEDMSQKTKNMLLKEIGTILKLKSDDGEEE